MAKFDFSELPLFLQPRLRLFLSVDLVGSTALKQSSRLPLPNPDSGFAESGGGPHWLAPISDFYLEFAEIFESCWQQHCEKTELPTGDAPSLWKANGDELIYVKDLNSRLELYSCLRAWIDSIKQYRVDHSKPSRLDIKATTWTAGFPVFNTEVVFFSNVSTAKYQYLYDSRLRHFELLQLWYDKPDMRSKLIRDFVGPAIDMGFRFATLSTPRRLVISLDIAWLLATASLPNKDGQEFAGLKMRYGGQSELKGVFSGRPYPYFWLDIMSDDKLTIAEGSLLEEPKSPSSDNVRHFCEAFYDSNRISLIRPFLVDDDYRYTEIPDRYFDTLQFWKGKLQDETDKYKKENEPPPTNVTQTEGGENIDESKVELLKRKLKKPRSIKARPSKRRTRKR